MTDTDVHEVDGTIAEELPPIEHHETSTAVARRERRSEVIRPLDSDALVDSFQAYQSLLPKLLRDDDYQDTGRGKRFVKKSGWRKIATAFDLDVQLIRSAVDRDDQGQPTRAEVWARAIAPSGRSMDGDGYCDVSEDRFRQASARKKLENDLRATATTRAMNRAISGLVGMGEVSAEEMSSGADDQPTFSPWAAPCNDGQLKQLRAALSFLLTAEPDGDAVNDIIATIEKDHGGPGVPWIASRSVLHVAVALKTLTEKAAPAPAAEPGADIKL